MAFLLLAVVILVFFLAILYTVYCYAYAPFQVFKRHGIPGPTPLPFFGNYFMVQKMGWIELPAKMLQTYGPVSGYYVGRLPIIVVGDLEMLKVILVQQFDSFMDREAVPEFFYKTVGLPPGLFMARGEQWKRSRQSISPSFSALKLKLIAPCIGNTCLKLADNLGEHANSGRSIDVIEIYSFITMESILAIVFGQVADLQKGEEDTIVKAASVLFTAVDGNMITLLWFILSHFPFLEPLLGFILKNSWRGHYFKAIYEAFTNIVLVQREKSNTKFKDMLQLMSEASIKDGSGNTRKLTVKEMVSHAITFLMAGYETTSNALGYTSYLLALNPSVQEKLHWEIEQYFERKPDASLFDASQEVEYVDMVLQESLRLFPPASGTLRHCSKTTNVGGVTIPKGAWVVVPTLQIQHSPEYWPDPEKFIPERFTAEEKAKRPSICHMPFGWGPRNCIGSRFAVMEIKMMLVQVLRKYKFVQAPDTEVPLQTVFRLAMAPKHGIHLRMATW